jgi:pyruvate,water dikinase
VSSSWVLDWSQAEKAGASVCGGKGWNLGRLQRFGFRVPHGGVLVAEAYRHFFLAEALRDPLRSVAALAPHELIPGMQALTVLHDAIVATSWPRDIEDAVGSFLREQHLDSLPLAVRSSATAEDSAAASFAGIHSSFLNVCGLQDTLQAIKGCFASLWTPQALAYRRRLGLADADVACAVVLCAMVQSVEGGPPRAAGVAFSCDPRTGRRDQITINAVPGLGESLVSGRVNPEDIAVVLDRGTMKIMSRAGAAQPVLSDADALALARLTLRVHWALGEGVQPQDVEWVHDGEGFWLVQARPVTRLPRPTFAVLANQPVIWSNANLEDILPGVQSTLGWNFTQTTIRNIAWAALEAIGYPLPAGMETARRIEGRAYVDLSALQWAFHDAFGLLPADTNRTLGGHQPEIAVPPGNPLLGWKGLARLWRRWQLLRRLLELPRAFPRAILRLEEAVREANALDLESLSSAELLEASYRLRDAQVDFSSRYQLAIINSGAWQGPLEMLLRRLSPARATALTAALMAGSGSVVSAEQGYRLFDLVAAAQHDADAQSYLHAQPRDPHGWKQLPAASPFRQALENFLRDFGHRGVYELMIANPRWEEDPTYLLDQVRVLLDAGRTRPPQDAAQARRAEAEAELRRVSWLTRPLVRWLAGCARRSAALREAGKSALVAAIAPARRMLLDTGRRMIAAGILDQRDDVFHLSWPDIETWLRGEWDGAGARALVAERQSRDAQWRSLHPEDVHILDTDGNPATLPAMTIAANAATPVVLQGRELKGVGVAAGRATGVARLVRHPEEGTRLQPGEVLVAPSTDPGWTPLFLRAAGVVMEVGGYLSHGAIVAREYGLPAVVNLPGLLDLVQDGQRLTVDGDQGCVILEDR